MAKNSSHTQANMDMVIPKGGGVYVFPPRALSIVWGNDARYWTIKADAAELVQVCWLQVTGSTEGLKSKQEDGSTKDVELEPGKYEVIFKVSLTEGAFGWTNCSVRVMAKPGKKGGQTWQKLDMSNLTTKPSETKCSVKIENGGDKNIYFGLYEVWSGRWKGGLVIHNVEIKKVD